MAKTGVIYGTNGPVASLLGDSGFQMSEMVHVGQEKLVGKVIGLNSEKIIIQVYEETNGVKPGETTTGTSAPASATLVPGIPSNVFDGIGRPLSEVAKGSGCCINRGISVNSLDTDRKWDTHMAMGEGNRTMPGIIITEVPETRVTTHKVMTPPDAEGHVLTMVSDGRYTIEEPLLTLQFMDGTERTLTMVQKRSIRVARPSARRFPAAKPLIIDRRILDTMLPLAKGDTAVILGGFGTGKIVTRHQVAEWSGVDVIIYIDCGEHGNKMTQVLGEFSEFIDSGIGNPLMDKTTLIANTSSMSVAAREASLYSGLTLAEYYRGMGYHVTVMVDSTSRQVKALKELSGRLEEMPAEEGLPAYLASHLLAFYERVGMMQNLNGTEGSVAIIGAVSPQGGDLSEPATVSTRRFMRCFWGLDKSLAYARYFPTIHWFTNCSKYINDPSSWYMDNVGRRLVDDWNHPVALLVQKSNLMEIVKLVGADVLPDDQKLVFEIIKAIRLGFPQQNAFHKDDTSVSLTKQSKTMEVIFYLYEKSHPLVSMGMPVSVLKEEDIFDEIISIKYDVPNNHLEMFDDYMKMIDGLYNRVVEWNA